MSVLNAVLGWTFELLMRSFAGLPAIVSVAVFSLLTSIVMLVVFKHTSDQTRLADVKRQIHAGLFEIRLHSDDLRVILSAQLEILRANLTYLRLSLVPMVWIIVPLTLLIAQLQFYYGYAGLRPGQSALVEVDLQKDAARAAGRPEASLEIPDGLRAETGAVWLPALSQVAWRIAAEREGAYELRLRVGKSEPVAKSVRVASSLARLSPLRHDGNLLDSILYPAEPPLPSGSPIRAIRVSYPEAEIDILGHGFQWMIPFFVLSIVFAFALRGLFKVTI
jgi:uncharacterized membrane protein (DUF106 family)